MPEIWDAVVIGAGIGGLSAAAYLVKEGLRVLVLERNLHPGGTAYLYQRKGFLFPMGPLGFSSPLLVRDNLRELEADHNFSLQSVKYKLWALGVKLILSAPFEDLKDECKRLFPGEERGIDAFFADMRRIAAEMKRTGIDNLSNQLREAAAIPASAYLCEHIRDERLRRILGSMGAREPYSNLLLLASMWDLISQQGIYYPREGMASFCRRLAEKATTSGAAGGVGEIRLGSEVSGIRVKNSQVRGITLMDGTHIDSQAVISNADFKTTYLKLLDQRVVPPEWINAVSRARQTSSNFQVCLGLDSNKVDLSIFSEASRLIYQRNGKEREEVIDKPFCSDPEISPSALASQELEVSLWSADDRSLSPPGGEVMVIRTVADYGQFASYRPSRGKRSPSYREHKNRLAFDLIREVEKLAPGLEEAIMVMDVATPLTFEEKGGRSEGAVAGWSWEFEDSRNFQAIELIRTPLKGLYMAGYQAFSSLFYGGVPSAMESGRRAAQAVLAGAEPAVEVNIPHREEG